MIFRSPDVKISHKIYGLSKYHCYFPEHLRNLGNEGRSLGRNNIKRFIVKFHCSEVSSKNSSYFRRREILYKIFLLHLSCNIIFLSVLHSDR